MDAAEIAALLQLAAILEPQAVSLINNLMQSFNSTGTIADKMKQLIDLQGGLKPMELKP